MYALVGSKEVEQRDGGRGDVSDHDAHYQQHQVTAYDSGKEEYECHHEHCADECGKYDEQGEIGGEK